jgi:hypothetical protein
MFSKSLKILSIRQDMCGYCFRSGAIYGKRRSTTTTCDTLVLCPICRMSAHLAPHSTGKLLSIGLSLNGNGLQRCKEDRVPIISAVMHESLLCFKNRLSATPSTPSKSCAALRTASIHAVQTEKIKRRGFCSISLFLRGAQSACSRCLDDDPAQTRPSNYLRKGLPATPAL